MNKEGEPYITFISNEAAEYIRALLIERLKAGEQIGRLLPVYYSERGEAAFTQAV
ncbi:MAG: hypothetical protein QXQ47_08320 [Candidatus Bathyarchaeia archaeon]